MSRLAAQTAASGSSADAFSVRIPFLSAPPRGAAVTFGDEGDNLAREQVATEWQHGPEGKSRQVEAAETLLIWWPSLNRGCGCLQYGLATPSATA